MKKIALVLALLVFMFGFSQQLKPNLLQIEKAVTDKNSPYFYEKLVYRFAWNPTMMDTTELHHLYYGKSFSTYDVPPFSDDENELYSLFSNGEYPKAIEKGEIMVRREPASLKVLAILVQAYEAADKNNKNYQLRAMQFGKLVDIIFRSGDGKTEEKAFVVTDIADEYIISQILGENLGNYHRTSEMQTDGVYDIWKKPNGKKLVFKVIRGNQ